MPFTYEQALMFLYMLVAVMLIIVLYHALFIVVDLRKIMRRAQNVTTEVEKVILRPLSMADQIMDFVMDLINQKKHAHKKKLPSDE